jgi:radical SAM-linked protein
MRLRVTFAKTEEMRYTGHLDLHRTWERTFRRAGLPLAYSLGFHPQPRINLASALPLGFTSECEIADVWLERSIPPAEARAALEQALPPGIQIGDIQEVEEKEPALQTQVIASEYVITLMDPQPHLEQRLQDLLAAESLPRERRGKRYDLRPLVEEVQQLPEDKQQRTRLFLRLASRPGATGRPEELLSALDILPASALVHRSKLIFDQPAQSTNTAIPLGPVAG